MDAADKQNDERIQIMPEAHASSESKKNAQAKGHKLSHNR